MTYQTDIGEIVIIGDTAVLNGAHEINFDSAVYHIGYSLGLLDIDESGNVGMSKVYSLMMSEVGSA